MSSIFKKKQFWGGLVAVAILVFLFYDIDIARSADVARHLDFWFLIPAIICTTLLLVFKTLRWMVIVGKVRPLLFWPTLFLYSAAQLVAVLLPALTGQAGRVLLFSRKGDFAKTYVFSTIFLEVVLDGAGLIGLMLLSSSVIVFPERYQFISYIIGAATLLLVILFYASLNFQDRIERFSHERIRKRSVKTYLILKKFVRSFNDGISVIKSTDKLFVVSSTTFLAWASHIGSVFFLFHAFNFDLPVSAAVVVIIINYLALMVPVTPGNLGSFQLAVVAALNVFSIPKTEAVLFSMILYVMDMVPMIVLGAFFMFKEQVSIVEMRSDEDLIAEVQKFVSESDSSVESEEGRT